MSLVRWEDPPQYARQRGNWQRTADTLSARPGTWALVVDDDTPNYAYRVSQTLKDYGCEVRTLMQHKRVSVWARWPL